MSGSLFSPAAPPPAPEGQPTASPPSDNRPTPPPDVILPSHQVQDSGLPDVLMTPEERALLGQPQQPPPAGQQAPDQGQGQDDPGQGQQPPQGDPGGQQGNPAERAPPGYVPAQALAEARAAQRQMREQMQRMEAQMQAFLAGAQQGRQPPPQETPIPDVQTDPVGHFQARTQMLERQLQQMAAATGQVVQQTQQQAQEAQFLEAYTAQALAFAEAQPEFRPAYAAWFNGLVAEAQAAGLEPQEALGWARQQEHAVAFRAMQAGTNPAERILAMAKVRGWRAPQAPQQPQGEPGQPGAQQPGQVDPMAAFGALERGMGASRSVGANGVPGAPASGLTAERIAGMSMDDFARATEGDNWERMWR